MGRATAFMPFFFEDFPGNVSLAASGTHAVGLAGLYACALPVTIQTLLPSLLAWLLSSVPMTRRAFSLFL